MKWNNLPLKNGSIGDILISNGRVLRWGNYDVVFLNVSKNEVIWEYKTHTKYDLLIGDDGSGISGMILFKLNDIWGVLQVVHGFTIFGGDDLQRKVLMYHFLKAVFGACCATRFLDSEKMESFYSSPSYQFDDIRHKMDRGDLLSYGTIYQYGLSVAYATDRKETWWGDATYTTLVSVHPEQGCDDDYNCPGIICSVVFKDRISGTWYVSTPIFHKGATYYIGSNWDWEVKTSHFPRRTYQLWSNKGHYDGGAVVDVSPFCLILNYSNGKLTTRLGAPTIDVFYEDQPTKTTAKSLLFSMDGRVYTDDNGYNRVPTNYMGEGKTEAEADAIKIDPNTYDYRITKKKFRLSNDGIHKAFEVWIQNQRTPVPYLDFSMSPPAIQKDELTPYKEAIFEPLLNSRNYSAISSEILYSKISGGSLDNPPSPNLDDYPDVISNPNLFFEAEIRPINKPWFTDKDVNIFYFTDSQKAMDFCSFMESL